VLFGPTASGKTDILLRLFAGVNCPISAEVISADSMQVYRGMDIGTAKPGPAEREKLPHHLIDIRNPDEQFNAGDFVRLADEACADIWQRGKLPVVSGGTGFYLKNFIQGLGEAPPSDPEIRAALKVDLQTMGASALMEELAAADPVSAARIHINDRYRLLRALEVCRLTGQPLSSYTASIPRFRGLYRFLIIGLERKREELYRRINQRCEAMFREGLPGEVEALREAGYGAEDPGLNAIGYKEFFIEDFLEDPKESYESNPEFPVESSAKKFRISTDLKGVEVLVAQNSRHYAKRQITFFKLIPGVTWIDVAASDPVQKIRRELENFLTF
jgi:tRNA dimethylallyltransferase